MTLPVGACTLCPVRYFRTDVAELAKPETLPNGWLRVDAFISRTGIQVYERDGRPFREYRPPSEVFKADTLQSFSGVPVTNQHPPDGHLDAHNTKHYQVGTVDSPVKDGTRTRARLLLTDADAIAAVGAGRRQLSCGYMCDLEEVPGTSPEGERYDAIQRNISGNHVALVDEARGGAELTMRLDSAGALIDGAPKPPVQSPQVQQKGTQVMTPEEAKKLMEEAAAAKVRADTAQAQLDAQKARADAAEAKVAALTAEVAALPSKMQATAKARSALEEQARKVTDSKFDGLSDRQVKIAAVNATGTVTVTDEKSDAYIDALFDVMVVNSKPRTDTTATVETVTPAATKDVIAEAQAKFLARLSK